MQREPLSQRAKGRWQGILPAVGISQGHLTGKHGPCPVCRSGKDRFRFTDREGSGSWICNQCGHGDGIDLVKAVHDIDFKEAAKLIEREIGAAPVQPSRPGMTDAMKRAGLRELWAASLPVSTGDPVWRYLTGRLGRVAVPRDIRLAEHSKWTSGHPAMIAMIRDAAGEPCQIHRTYLTRDGRKANTTPCRRLMPGAIRQGSAVRLMPAGMVLGIAEGIETAWAASILHDVPVWAALNTTMLAKWQPPEGVEHVIVFGDNDANYAGQKAAYELASKLASTHRVTVRVPPDTGTDWNDVLARQQAAA